MSIAIQAVSSNGPAVLRTVLGVLEGLIGQPALRFLHSSLINSYPPPQLKKMSGGYTERHIHAFPGVQTIHTGSGPHTPEHINCRLPNILIVPKAIYKDGCGMDQDGIWTTISLKGMPPLNIIPEINRSRNSTHSKEENKLVLLLTIIPERPAALPIPMSAYGSLLASATFSKSMYLASPRSPGFVNADHFLRHREFLYSWDLKIKIRDRDSTHSKEENKPALPLTIIPDNADWEMPFRGEVEAGEREAVEETFKDAHDTAGPATPTDSNDMPRDWDILSGHVGPQDLASLPQDIPSVQP
ncbi:hypothetical protein BDP27DRAFT_1360521 [Rhodocollybia butyracea]|uniref:Uncharacterized protein n=1 Tax=Rhodocollybia butyracea TaxID=206335 RepID=A0A9P5UBF3_9AGAR|nr:hypothetical protein BDP27DRAFT_1360521 [Rhodocollybia butyracea]